MKFGHILPLTFLLLATAAHALSESDFTWSVYKIKHGITIYKGKPRHKLQTFGITPLKISTTLNYDISKVIWVIADSTRKIEWIPQLEESLSVHIDAVFDRTEYSRYDSPWPFNDRTFVVRSQGEIDKKNQEVRIRVNSVDHKNAPNDKAYVRAISHFGILKFRPKDHFKKTFFEMTFLTDFKGNIPKWIINMVQIRWPFKFIKALKKQLAKGDIQIPKDFDIKKQLQ